MNTKLVAMAGVVVVSAALLSACTWGKPAPAAVEQTGSDGMAAPADVNVDVPGMGAGKSGQEMQYGEGAGAQSSSSTQPNNEVKYEGKTQPYDKSMGVY